MKPGASMNVPSTESNALARLWKRWFTLQTSDPDEMFRERTVRGLLPILAFVAVAGSLLVWGSGEAKVLPVFVGMGLVILVAAWAVANGRLNLAAVLVFLVPVVTAVGSLFSSGYLSTGGIVMSYLAVILGAVVLPRRITKFLPVGMVIIYGIIAFSIGPFGPGPTPEDKIASGPLPQTIEVAILSTLFFGIGYYLLNELESRRKQLILLVGTLEERVAERTRDLTIAADVSQQIIRELDLEKLLPQLTELTCSSFDLYHVSIYLRDAATNLLHLQSSAGETGHQMVIQQTQFTPDARGLVPLVAREQQPQVINDVRLSSEFRPNPVLPNTRSEAVLPMFVGDQLIGVLDLQSDEANKFTESDSKVLTTLAQQIAIAVRNAQLFAEAHQARLEAERANRAKSQFLASMSHELRTPLNAILNFTQFVSMGIVGSVNAEQVDLLDKVVHSGQHLLSLINDVLDISKIEAGALKLYIESDVDVAHEAKAVVEVAKTLVQDKAITIDVTLADNLPPILADKRRLRQIMLNLVSNACKFTEQGSIRIVLEQQQQDILFAVHDTGSGIAVEEAKAVFEVFHQTASGLRHGGGTGLGLAISLRLAEAHGGRLWMTSNVGQGSSFFVSIPIHSAALQTVFEESRHVA